MRYCAGRIRYADDAGKAELTGDDRAVGEHAAFIWAAYAVAAVILVGLGLMSWQRFRASRDDLGTLERQRPRRRREGP